MKGAMERGSRTFSQKKKTIVKVSRHIYTCTQIRYSTKSLIANVKVWVSVSHNRDGTRRGGHTRLPGAPAGERTS